MIEPLPGSDRAAIAGDPASQGPQRLPGPWEDFLWPLYDSLGTFIRRAQRLRLCIAKLEWERQNSAPRPAKPIRRSTDDLLNSL